jgi:hypothetical protein
MESRSSRTRLPSKKPLLLSKNKWLMRSPLVVIWSSNRRRYRRCSRLSTNSRLTNNRCSKKKCKLRSR